MRTTTRAHDTVEGAGGAGAWFDRWATQYDSERRLLISPFDAYYAAAAEAAALRPGGSAGDDADARGTGEGRASHRPPGRRTEGADGGPVRVLDLGAGTGLLTAVVEGALPGAQLTLLDEAPGMLAQAGERFAAIADRITLVRGDLLGDLPDGPWDVIVSGLAIHHLEPADQARVYAKAHERLAPGGVFVNAEQLKAPARWLESHFIERELVHARAGGFTPEAEEQAWERWSLDRHVTLSDQMGWLHDAGYETVECVFKAWRFAVVAGWRSE